MQNFIALPLGIMVTAIGALPFGLVNLTVLDVSSRNSYKEAMHVAHGAALVEVLFALIAVLTGRFVENLLNENQILKYLVVGILTVTGFIFIFMKNAAQGKSELKIFGFLKGVFLNGISIQVLLFWIIVIALLFDHQIFHNNPLFLLLFLTGVWMGKIIVLWFYAILYRMVNLKSGILAGKINKLIGSILILTAIIHAFKI